MRCFSPLGLEMPLLVPLQAKWSLGVSGFMVAAVLLSRVFRAGSMGFPFECARVCNRRSEIFANFTFQPFRGCLDQDLVGGGTWRERGWLGLCISISSAYRVNYQICAKAKDSCGSSFRERLPVVYTLCTTVVYTLCTTDLFFNFHATSPNSAFSLKVGDHAFAFSKSGAAPTKPGKPLLSWLSIRSLPARHLGRRRR